MVRHIFVLVMLCAVHLCTAQSFKIVKKFTHPDRGTSLQTVRTYGSTILSVIIHQDTFITYMLNGNREGENKMILLYGDSTDPNFSGSVINERGSSRSFLSSDINNLKYFGNETYNTALNYGGSFYSNLSPIGRFVRKNYFTVNTDNFIMDGFEMKDGSMLMCGQDMSTNPGRADPFYMIIGKNGLLKFMHTDIAPSGIQGFYNKGYELANKDLVFIRSISTAYLAEFFDSTGVKYRTDTITRAPGPNFSLFGPKFTFTPDSSIISSAYCYNPLTRQAYTILTKYNYHTGSILWIKNMKRFTITSLYVNQDNYLYFQRRNDDSLRYDFVVMKDTAEIFSKKLVDTPRAGHAFYLDDFVPYDDSTTIGLGLDVRISPRASWLFIKGMGKQFNPITLSPSLWHGPAAPGMLSFYPNPARERIFITPPKDQHLKLLRCYDMQGRLVWERIQLPEEERIPVELNQPAGVYMLQAQTSGGQWLRGRLVVR